MRRIGEILFQCLAMFYTPHLYELNALKNVSQRRRNFVKVRGLSTCQLVNLSIFLAVRLLRTAHTINSICL